jgi:hypothetical protein
MCVSENRNKIARSRRQREINEKKQTGKYVSKAE